MSDSQFDPALLERAVEAAIARDPRLAWMRDAASAIIAGIDDIPPLTDEKHRYIDDFVYSH